MALREIKKIGDPALRAGARPVGSVDKRIRDLLDDLHETMRAAEGYGIAAPQVGVLRRVVVIDVGEGRIDLINPVIVSRDGEQVGEEGCLSVPEHRGTVARPMKVTVEALDYQGQPFTLNGEGLLARCLCHELDHLDGVLFVDLEQKEDDHD